MVSRVSMLRRAFLVSASFPIASLIVGQPAQAQVVIGAPTPPATSTPVSAVNAQIQTAAAAGGRDLDVKINADAVIAGPGTVQAFSPAAGKADGKISLTNLGTIGAVSADGTTVTNFAGIGLFGVGQGTTDNSAILISNGLVTSGLTASNFGGDVAITNGGLLFGGIFAQGYGNVSVTSGGSGSAVRTGGISANASTTTTTTGPSADGVTKTTVTGGATTVTVSSDLGTAASKGAVNAFSGSNTAVTVSALAGAVSATATNTANSVTQSLQPAAGQTVTTFSSASTVNPGNASVTIGTGGSVDSAQATGISNSTVAVGAGGKIAGFASATYNGASDTTSKTTQTQNAADTATTQLVTTTSSTARGPAAKVLVDATGSVGGAVNASGITSAAITNAGTITGNATASTSNFGATSFTTSSTTNRTDANVLASTRFVTARSAPGGAASIDVAKGGAIVGSVFASGDSGASITNAGTIGVTATPVSVIASSNRTIQVLNDVATTYAADGVAIATQNSTIENKSVGGATSITNTADGLITTSGMQASGVGPVTIVNAGTVRGPTFGSSAGTDTLTQTVFSQATSDTTTTSSNGSTVTTTQLGSTVTGTYSGANGTLNFTPSANGSISQFATTDSLATITGSVFGSVTSSGGANGSNSVVATQTDSKSVLDKTGAGTNTFATSKTTTTNSVAGSGIVNVNGGTVGLGNAGFTPSVTASGTKAATATIANGTLEGGLSVSAPGVQTSVQTTGNSFTQAIAAFTPTSTTAFTNTTSNKTTNTDGVASATLTGTTTTGSKTNGAVNVTGNSATATVGVGAKVGTTALPASLFVAANTFDGSNSDSATYARDPSTTVVTATGTTASASAPSATAGNAAATVAGTVTGATSVTAGGGNATATINGNTNSVGATASSTNFATTTTNTYSGKAAATTATALTATGLDAALSAIKIGSTTTTTNTVVGGKATVLVDSSDAVKAASVSASPNNVGVTTFATASGVGGATVTVTSGSLVGGAVSASSLFSSTANKSTNTYTAGVLTTNTQNNSTSVTGGAAIVTNAGAIAGSVTASGAVSAEIANTGKLGTIGGGSLYSANAIGINTATTVTDTNINNAALENQVTKVVQTASGGAAKFGNGAAGVVLGTVSLSGGTGAFTNDGTLVGTTRLGQPSVADYTLTTTRTASTTTQTISQPNALFAQTYTMNQNGTSGGFTVGSVPASLGATAPVGGVLITDPTDPTGVRTLQTTSIAATINLNSGSATIGDITAQTDNKTGARLTNTTVNLNGSGFLGVDYALPTTGIATTILPVARVTPELTLTKDATTYATLGLPDATGNVKIASYAGSNGAVRVSGVTTLAKSGAGTFVITGAPYLTSTTVGAAPIYTLNVGNFNINAGEVQLALGAAGSLPSGYTALNEFAINGNVTNNASLVLGRRAPSSVALVGNSLVGTGPEVINGITVRQVGNFTQGSGGTLVVGATPSLVRFAPVTVNPFGTSSEALGVITSGVTVPYFTTVQNAGVPIANSVLNVTGNLTLGGNVLVEVSRDSLFSTGDGYTLASYTGTGTVTATASTTLTSPFVKFAVVNDAASKTVRLSATRTSFASATSDRNAAAAAVGLDSAIATIVSRIKTDAAGGAGFATVSQIGYAQDLANIVTALDFRLSSDQAAQVFRELSSAELYGSLSAINQNVVFGDTVNQLTGRRAYGEALGTRIWLNPAGNFAKYGGEKYGASKIKVNSYGIAGGLDFAYTDTGAFGIGGAYGKHDVNTLGTSDKADISTYTLGAYLTQGIGDFYVNGTVAYGFSRFRTTRVLTLLARTIYGSFNGNQLDAALEGGYDFKTGSVTITPFAKAALRRYSMNSFNETSGGGAGLGVQKKTKSIFSPVIGVKVGAAVGDLEGLSVRPYGKVSYTFQGHLGEDRSVQFLGGGDRFTLHGVDPRNYGTAEIGLDGSLTPRMSVFVSGGYSFAGHNNVGTLRGGLGFKF